MKLNKSINKKNYENLRIKLLVLLREQLNMRIQHSKNKLKKTHLFKQVRHDIARIKVFINKN